MNTPIAPAFDQPVSQNGYAWWYLDAISDDGRYGLTVIAFIGSVFSPYYAWARKRGLGDPLAHCAINVALYGPRGRWCMTERTGKSVLREPESLHIGPSSLRWDGDSLIYDIKEWAVPIPRRIGGQIRVHPRVVGGQRTALDPDHRHHWTPFFPAARVELSMQHPDLNWSGHGYFDHNSGSEPLEDCFDNWHWSRAETSAGPVILYDSLYRSGERSSLALSFSRNGEQNSLPLPPAAALPHSRWGVARATQSDDRRAQIKSVWEDTPFYSRELINTRLCGERVTAVHESLSLRRFSKLWVQPMLPFRMPRRTGKLVKQRQN